MAESNNPKQRYLLIFIGRVEENPITYQILNELNYGWVLLTLTVSFALLYFSICGGLYGVVNWAFNKKIAEPVRTEKRFPNQIWFEIRHSWMSIIIFGAYGLLIVFSYRQGWVDILQDGGVWIFIDLLLLVVWNEIHFYAGHKLMHTKALLSIHRTHHKSIVVSPFSTYSFHPIESVIMGSVMILPMFVYDFQLWALILFPVYSLVFNALGHSNARLTKKSTLRKLEISQQHNDHHTKFNHNFGFVSELMDRIFRTHYKNKKKADRAK